MSVEAMTWVFKHSQTRGVHRLVLLAIADSHGERGAWPAHETIAAKAQVSVRTVKRAIAEACKLGELTVDYKAAPHGTNLYRIPILSPGQDVTGSEQVKDQAIAVAYEPKEPNVVRDLGSSGSSSVSTTTAHPAADAADDDPFPAEDWRFLLDKLHRRGWTAEGHGALTWGYVMRQRLTYGSRVVDSALRDCTYNDSPPVLSAAAYFTGTCERFKAVAS